MYARILTAWWAGEGFLPTLHDDDELLFKSRVILLFKIPISKLLHARERARTKRKDLSLTICCLFVCWLVCCVCVVPRRRYCYYGKYAGPRVPPLFYPQSHYSVGGSSGDCTSRAHVIKPYIRGYYGYGSGDNDDDNDDTMTFRYVSCIAL